MPAVISTAILSLFTSFAAPHDARAERAPGLTEAKTYELNAYRAKFKALHEARLARAESAERAERPERATRAKAERPDRRANRAKRGKWSFCDAVGCTDAQVAQIEGIRAAFENDAANQRASMKQLHEAIRAESRSESPDDGAIRGMREKLAAVGLSLHASHREMNEAVFAVLTDAQRDRLEAMKAAKSERKSERKAERKAERKSERKSERTERPSPERKADRTIRSLERRPERPVVAPVSRDRLAARR